METGETLYHWHCVCGYNNVGFDPCAGCHRRAPRRIRANTTALLDARAEAETESAQPGESPAAPAAPAGRAARKHT